MNLFYSPGIEVVVEKMVVEKMVVEKMVVEKMVVEKMVVEKEMVETGAKVETMCLVSLVNIEKYDNNSPDKISK